MPNERNVASTAPGPQRCSSGELLLSSPQAAVHCAAYASTQESSLTGFTRRASVSSSYGAEAYLHRGMKRALDMLRRFCERHEPFWRWYACLEAF